MFVSWVGRCCPGTHCGLLQRAKINSRDVLMDALVSLWLLITPCCFYEPPICPKLDKWPSLSRDSIKDGVASFGGVVKDPQTLELPRTISILLLGSKAVGKTALAQRFLSGSLEDAEIRYVPTNCVSGFWRTSMVEKERAAIHVLDTPGTYDVEDAGDTVKDHGEPQFVLSGEHGTEEANPQPSVQSVLEEQSGWTFAAIVVVFDVNRRASFEATTLIMSCMG
jgi:hypothetical protein